MADLEVSPDPLLPFSRQISKMMFGTQMTEYFGSNLTFTRETQSFVKIPKSATASYLNMHKDIYKMTYKLSRAFCSSTQVVYSCFLRDLPPFLSCVVYLIFRCS
jgi:hypothetical protein